MYHTETCRATADELQGHQKSPISIAEANQQVGFMNIQYTMSKPQGSD
jgi:hypothetical protein